MKRPVVSLTAASVACLALAVVLTGVVWGGFGAFLRSIDTDDLPLFMDFAGHYYPTARDLLATATPAEGFYYPASFALSIVPLTWLPPAGALLAWGVLQAVAAVALMVTAGLLLWPRGRAFAFGAVALTAASLPLWHGYRWGQVSAAVTALMLGALLARRGRAWLAPSLLALAAAIKVFPGILAFQWLAARDFSRLTRFGAAAAVLLVLAPLLAMGPSGLWKFTERARLASGHAVETWVPRDPNSQYLPFVAARWADSSEPAAGQPAPPPREPAGVRVLAWLLFLANLGAVVRLALRGNEDESLAAALLFTALPFVLPTSWPHYFVFLPFCQVVALARALAEPRVWLRAALAGVTGLSMFLASVPAFALAGGHPSYSRLGFLCVANLALLAVLQAEAAVTSAAAEAPPPTRDRPRSASRSKSSR